MVIEDTLLKTEFQKIEVVNDISVRVFILVRKNFSFDGKNLVSNINCYGKTIKEWAISSAGNYPCNVIEYTLTDNILDIIKPYLGKEKISVVLYCETPLMRQSTLVGLINDFVYKNQKVRKFKRGYIFDTEFIKNAESICAPEIGQESGEDFLAITNTNDLNYAMQVMKNRIMSYHIANGVQIIDINSTYIEAEVDLQAGVIIYPNNNILGRTVIESGSIIYPNSIIKDSYICANSKIIASFIENAKIQENTVIEPFTKIILDSNKK